MCVGAAGSKVPRPAAEGPHQPNDGDAAARAVEVGVAVREDQLWLEVTDNGVGLGQARRRSGLANLAARAAQLGGGLKVESTPSAGTRIRWQVPLSV